MSEKIDAMVSRFLAWRLPENFSPDGGVSFQPTFRTVGGGEMKAAPTGTNLLTYTQAKAMLLHVVGDAVSAEVTPTDHVVEAVRADLLRRSVLGIAKYGVTLDRTDLTLRDWLQHAYEETMDQANYLKRAILELEKPDAR